MRFSIAVMSVLLMTAPAFAQQSQTTRIMKDAMIDAGMILFDAAERAIIEEFFGHTATNVYQPHYGEGHDDIGRGGKKDKSWKKNKGNGKGMPPGLAKRGGSLPPGLQRQLERNGRLPPGLAKRDLPNDLTHRLPPPRPGTERVIAGADVLLVHVATGVVLDILRDVVSC